MEIRGVEAEAFEGRKILEHGGEPSVCCWSEVALEEFENEIGRAFVQLQSVLGASCGGRERRRHQY
jgi:hypothetical protein